MRRFQLRTSFNVLFLLINLSILALLLYYIETSENVQRDDFVRYEVLEVPAERKERQLTQPLQPQPLQPQPLRPQPRQDQPLQPKSKRDLNITDEIPIPFGIPLSKWNNNWDG